MCVCVLCIKPVDKTLDTENVLVIWFENVDILLVSLFGSLVMLCENLIILFRSRFHHVIKTLPSFIANVTTDKYHAKWDAGFVLHFTYMKMRIHVQMWIEKNVR